MSADEPQRSPDGTELKQYSERVHEADAVSGGDERLIEAVGDHLTEHFGPEPAVFHEVVSPTVHVDLFLSAATDDRLFHVVTTCGMAELPMRPPGEEVADLTHAELFMLLPPDWPLEHEAFKDERNWWPLRLLKQLARLPHEYDTWLWTGHTVPNGDPPEPYAAGTGLCCALLVPPLGVPDGFAELERPDAATIHFLMVLPIHQDEMRLKLDEGLDALVDRFDAAL